MSHRIETLLNELKSNQLDSFLVTSQANVYYLSNYYTDPHERVVAVYISLAHDPILILPAMEKEDAINAGWSYNIIDYHDHENPWQLFHTYLKKNEKIPQVIGLEYNHMTVERYHTLNEILPNSKLIDGKEILANLRVYKSKNEYQLLKQAAELADFGIETGVKTLQEGVSELEVIAKIEYELKKQGVQEMSFSTMTLFGNKTASPHGNPGKDKLKKGDMVLFDLGVIYEGYCSDITRSFGFQFITDEQKDIYETVLEANQIAIDTAKIGTAVGELDQKARQHIEKAGYGTYFNHRIGHGLGLETHEYPSMHSNNTLALQEGMCFTIEPGIYVPDLGGVRIEDMMFMAKDGAETLTKYPKKLQIL